MKTVRLINETRQAMIGEHVGVADTLWSRGRGLMFRQSLEDGSGLLINPCSSIHTMWMRFPIDILYLGHDNIVLRVDSAMKPWRIGPVFTGARYVVELPAGSAAHSETQPGDQLTLVPATD